IEPFVTDGAGYVVEKGESGLFMVEKNVPTRSPFTKSFLKSAERFKGLPFARRYIDREMALPRSILH
ncbi:MAG: type II methionyl aminopeptidase, partial [Nanoarchaeota archaeon]